MERWSGRCIVFVVFLIFAVYFKREQTRFGTRRKVHDNSFFFSPYLLVVRMYMCIILQRTVFVRIFLGGWLTPKWQMEQLSDLQAFKDSWVHDLGQRCSTTQLKKSSKKEQHFRLTLARVLTQHFRQSHYL